MKGKELTPELKDLDEKICVVQGKLCRLQSKRNELMRRDICSKLGHDNIYPCKEVGFWVCKRCGYTLCTL